MSFSEHFVNNNGVSIHCLEYHKNNAQTPLIFIPGATNSADDIAQDLDGVLTRYHIIISLRGRGKSQAPEKGYTLENQASDVVAVINYLQLTSCILFGHSVGVPIAIQAAVALVPKVTAIILGDYAPCYPAFDKSWASRTKKAHPELNDALLNGLVADSEFINLVPSLKNLNLPVLLLKAGQKNSAFPVEAIPSFQNAITKGVVDIMTDRDHDLFSPSAHKLVERLEVFIEKISAQTT